MSREETPHHEQDGVCSSYGGVMVTVRVRPLAELRDEAGSAPSVLRGLIQQRLRCRGKTPQARREAEERPVVRVGVDRKTVVLLDPKNLQAIRESFAFDHVFSPVLLDAALAGAETVPGDGVSHPSKNSKRESLSTDISNVDAIVSNLRASKISIEERREELEQQQVYEVLGAPLAEHFMCGHNSCLLAYGEEGSGKSHTLSGTAQCVGLIPRICKDLLGRPALPRRGTPVDDRRAQEVVKDNAPPLQVSARACELRSAYTPARPGAVSSSSVRSTVTGSPWLPQRDSKEKGRVELTISYMEVCNDWVRDLLKPKKDKDTPNSDANTPIGAIDHSERLRVRYYPRHGPSVEGLTTIRMSSWADCWNYIQCGNVERQQLISQRKTNGHTHTVFRIASSQSDAHDEGSTSSESLPKIDIVELSSVTCLKSSGSSPKAAGTSTYEDCRRQMREFNAVQRSLGVLSRVLQALASGNRSAPYRENLLTHLLSDGLVSGSLTVFCATVVSDVSSYNETLATLRYAAQSCNPVSCVKCGGSLAAGVDGVNQRQIGRCVGNLPPQYEGSITVTGNDSKGRTAAVALPSWSGTGTPRVGGAGGVRGGGLLKKDGEKVSLVVECLPYISGAKAEHVGGDSDGSTGGVTVRSAVVQAGNLALDALAKKSQHSMGLPPLSGATGKASSDGVNSCVGRMKTNFSCTRSSGGESPRNGQEVWQLNDASSTSDKCSSIATDLFGASRSPTRPGSCSASRPHGATSGGGTFQPHVRNFEVGRTNTNAPYGVVLSGLSATVLSNRVVGIASLDDTRGNADVTLRVPLTDDKEDGPAFPWALQPRLSTPEPLRKKECRKNCVKVFSPEELQPTLPSPALSCLKHSYPPTPILSSKSNPILRSLGTSTAVPSSIK